MRLFVAVEIDAVVVQKLAECSAELRRRAARAPRARITWVPSERLHVTLRFIGEVDGEWAQGIVAALKPELGVMPFDATVEGVGSFPDRGAPRVFWAGIAAGLESLIALEQEVTARLERCGVPREERPYHPHVTLARVRDASGLRADPLLDGLRGERFGTSHVEAITLFQSQSSPKGHTYVRLQSTNLRSSM